MSLYDFDHNEARRGKIGSIKALRMVTDLGLKEAKEIVESIYEGCSESSNTNQRIHELEMQNRELIQKLNEATAALDKEIALTAVLMDNMYKHDIIDLLRKRI